MNKKLVLLFALTVVTCWVKAAEPHKIVVENAGTLQELLDATTEGIITKLIVKGELNGADIATLRELKTLRELDIKDVELIADDTPYYVYSYRGDGVWFTSYTRYFISKTRRHKRWSDGLSQASSQYSDYYDYNLAGAFQDMPLQKIVLPSSINEFGRMEFAGCTNLKEIEMVKDPVFVGEGACDGCTSLTTIPTLGNVTSMEQKAFMVCTNLTPSTLYKEVSLTLLDSIPAYASCDEVQSLTKDPGKRGFINAVMRGYVREMENPPIEDPWKRLEPHEKYAIPKDLWDVLVAGLFAFYIGYNWAIAQEYDCTIDNAIDACVGLYLNIVNLFLRVLSIMERDYYY
jgi:hypothetical protein